MRLRAALLSAACLAASGAAALDMPAGARLAQEQVRTDARYEVPIAPYRGETVAAQVLRGAVREQAWHVPGSALTPLQAIDVLRDQLANEGYTPAFDCDADQCGGFDFRFAIDVMDAPDMFVNLRDFHFATLLRGPEGAPDSAVTLLASRAQDRLYVQITRIAEQIGTPDRAPEPAAAPTPAPEPEAQAEARAENGISALPTRGAAVLEGLAFDTGATTLGPGPFEVLETLAAFLTANPGLRVALVGHTDSIGALDGNIRISKQRAQAVRRRLIERYGIAGSRLEAEGMGYLAPRGSNLTAAGRDANRRVEVIVLAED